MAIDPRVDIGHVHLKVADLDRSIAFYCDVLGFELQQRYGTQAAFVSAGGYHHHLGLNTWESAGGSAPPRTSTGLYHVAIRYPDRRTLADAARRVLDAGIPLDGASDHGVSEALYLRDPDGNGIELYRDRAREEWPRSADGELLMVSERLDVAGLLRELDSEGPANGAPRAPGAVTSGAAVASVEDGSGEPGPAGRDAAAAHAPAAGAPGVLEADDPAPDS